MVGIIRFAPLCFNEADCNARNMLKTWDNQLLRNQRVFQAFDSHKVDGQMKGSDVPETVPNPWLFLTFSTNDLRYESTLEAISDKYIHLHDLSFWTIMLIICE